MMRFYRLLRDLRKECDDRQTDNSGFRIYCMARILGKALEWFGSIGKSFRYLAYHLVV